MAEEHLNFVPLLFVLLLAFFVPLLLSRFKRVPVVVGEILVGILIGDSWLGLVSGDEPILNLLSQIGFAFLMFLSGLEIDFSLLFGTASGGIERKPWTKRIAGLSFLAALTLAVGAGWAFTLSGFVRDPWMMGLILSTTSLGIVVPVLKERGLSATNYGQALLLAALVADFSTMFLITFYVAVRSSGLSLDILLIGGLFLAVILVYRFGVWQMRRANFRRLLEALSGATTQLKVRGAMAMMIAFVVLAEFLGVELILGAFLAGAVISLLSGPEDHSLRHKLDGFGFGFFIPLFFIVVGLRFDLQAFLANPSSWLLAPLLLVSALIIKFVSAFFFRIAFSWRETFAAGALLSARLSLIIAASAIGLRLGAISQSTNAAIILVAALTATVAPLLFNTILPAEEAQAPKRILVYGQNNGASQVAGLLKKYDEDVILLNAEEPGERNQRNIGIDVLRLDFKGEIIEQLKGFRGKALIALDEDDDCNFDVCRAARQAGIPNIISQVNEPGRLQEFQHLGVQVYMPSLYQPTILALLARSPDLFQLLTSYSDDQDLREIHMLNNDCAGQPLKHLDLPGEMLILSINRQEELIIPHGNTRIEIGDRLTVLGDKEALEEITNWLENGRAA